MRSCANPGTRSVLGMEDAVADTEIGWADKLLEAYPDRLAIITTHFFLEANNEDNSNIFNEFNKYKVANFMTQLSFKDFAMLCIIFLYIVICML